MTYTKDEIVAAIKRCLPHQIYLSFRWGPSNDVYFDWHGVRFRVAPNGSTRGIDEPVRYNDTHLLMDALIMLELQNKSAPAKEGDGIIFVENGNNFYGAYDRADLVERAKELLGGNANLLTFRLNKLPSSPGGLLAFSVTLAPDGAVVRVKHESVVGFVESVQRRKGGVTFRVFAKDECDAVQVAEVRKKGVPSALRDQWGDRVK